MSKGLKKTPKKLEKSLKNPLTNGSECDIITKLTERERQGAQKATEFADQKSAKSPKLIEN